MQREQRQREAECHQQLYVRHAREDERAVGVGDAAEHRRATMAGEIARQRIRREKAGDEPTRTTKLCVAKGFPPVRR